MLHAAQDVLSIRGRKMMLYPQKKKHVRWRAETSMGVCIWSMYVRAGDVRQQRHENCNGGAGSKSSKPSRATRAIRTPAHNGRGFLPKPLAFEKSLISEENLIGGMQGVKTNNSPLPRGSASFGVVSDSPGYCSVTGVHGGKEIIKWRRNALKIYERSVKNEC